MDKKTYYITVASGEVLDSQEESNYDFEIKATDEEIDKLQELFEEKYDADVDSSLRSVIPLMEYHHDEPNDRHDYYMYEVYRMLHELGNDETRKHIERMNILH